MLFQGKRWKYGKKDFHTPAFGLKKMLQFIDGFYGL
jgi:hypothetical protein